MTSLRPWPVTIVCCVQPGPLEVGAQRLIESLRRWGGRWTDAPVIAIAPPGPLALSSIARRQLDSLQVRLVVRPRHAGYRWFPFINKPLAMALAEEIAETEQLCFLDSDILVLREPELLLLGDKEDFVACAPDVEQGTRGPGDTFEPLWAELCKANGIAPDDLPWITTRRTSERIRLYWNSGVFNVRRGEGFGSEYLAATERMLGARVRHNHSGFGIGICEQSAIGFAQAALGLRWRHLPGAYNYNMGRRIHAQQYRDEDLSDAVLLHYHDSMWPPFLEIFKDCLRRTHPDVLRWLEHVGPMTNPAPALHRVILKWQRTARAISERRFTNRCRVCGTSAALSAVDR